ncbi:hypothetical protein TRVL_07357 [Trypanosoma vivax]|uniref:Uncharacterized protein n=1 Tax=Trypanosoma vivax (strain Y486) TaxID=1055687 RepID=G0TV06_TRYVY|nr:hypothetical protein TRVL_07357 [Trypanosoma vivax]CCC48189.1 conserved hypothetical protein [Trypanosoma vivax Y486]
MGFLKSEDICNKMREATVTSSKPGGCTTQDSSSINTDVIARGESEAWMGTDVRSLEQDARRLCMEINRLVRYVDATGACCSAVTYRCLLQTLTQVRSVVARARRGCGRGVSLGVDPTSRSFKIQTPAVPEDLVV